MSLQKFDGRNEDPGKVANAIWGEDFSVDDEAFKYASDNLRDTGASGDEAGFAYWQSVFAAMCELWGNRECDMKRYQTLVMLDAYAAGYRPLTDAEMEARRKTNVRMNWITAAAYGEISDAELAQELGCSVEQATAFADERLRELDAEWEK